MSLVPCSACHRHVRRTETLCPFCGEARSSGERALRPSAASSRSGLGTAAVIALAAATSVACGGGSPEPESPPPVVPVDPEPDPETTPPIGEGTPEVPDTPDPEAGPGDPDRAVPMYGMPVPEDGPPTE